MLAQDTESTPDVKSEAASEKDCGYYLHSRCMRAHPVVGYRTGSPKAANPKQPCYAYATAWQYLIEEASFKPERTRKVGAHTYKLTLGQLVGSRRFLAAEWNWSEKTVRCFLAKLGAHKMLIWGPQKGTRMAVVTICNYAKYQVSSEAEGPAQGPAKVKSGAQDRKNYTNKLSNKKIPTLSSSDDLLPFVADADKANPAKLDTRTKVEDPVTNELTEVVVAFNRWNTVAKECGFQRANRLTPERKKKLSTLLKDGGLETFERAMSEMAKSKFLSGENDRGWKAHLDFLFERGKYDKILDGSYTFSGKTPPRGGGQRHFGLPVFK